MGPQRARCLRNPVPPRSCDWPALHPHAPSALGASPLLLRGPDHLPHPRIPSSSPAQNGQCVKHPPNARKLSRLFFKHKKLVMRQVQDPRMAESPKSAKNQDTMRPALCRDTPAQHRETKPFSHQVQARAASEAPGPARGAHHVPHGLRPSYRSSTAAWGPAAGRGCPGGLS